MTATPGPCEARRVNRTLTPLALALALAACGGKTVPGDEPDPIAYADAGPCREPGETASPLVVDIHPTDRQNFEIALNDKNAILAVHLDCKDGLKLLPECKAPGAYGFKGSTIKEQVITVETGDELKANLPSLGASMPQLGAELASGATLDVALAMVGKLRASRPLVGRDDLQGDCTGATHFIRGATIGAFAMKQGTRGHARAAASLFAEVSRSSDSKKSIEQHDGTREACARGGPKATEAPDECGAVLRLELRSLVPGKAEAAAPPPPVEVEEGCPDGMIFDAGQGKCRTAKAGEGVQCKYGDEKDCRDQCHAGHPGSCTFYASMLMEQDKLADARPYFEKGCNAGIPLACHNLAFAIWSGAGVQKDDGRAMQLFQQVCDGGTAVGCAGVALLFHEGSAASNIPKDLTKAFQFYEMACNGGDQLYGCPFLGRMYQNGEAVAPDPAKARALYQLACDAGSPNGCLLLKQM